MPWFLLAIGGAFYLLFKGTAPKVSASEMKGLGCSDKMKCPLPCPENPDPSQPSDGQDQPTPDFPKSEKADPMRGAGGPAKKYSPAQNPFKGKAKGSYDDIMPVIPDTDPEGLSEEYRMDEDGFDPENSGPVEEV